MVNDIDSASLHQRLTNGEEMLVVDIRTPAESAQGMIPDTLPIPMHLIPLRLNELPRDRDLVLYCRSGARSHQACAYMMQQGYHRVLNLRGGMIAWAGHGYPIIAPAA